MKLSTKLGLAALVLAASGCVKIPEAYYGNYADPSNGATLTLSQSKAELGLPDGRHLKASSKDLSLDDLAAAKSGIYDLEDKAAGVSEVYFVNANSGTRQQNAGFVWYNAEVIYTYFVMSQTGQVPSMQMIQCANGTVMIDTTTKRVEVGCPEGSTTYNLVRK